MKPAPFDYAAPVSIGEAVDLLREHGSDAKLLAGGQSLMPALNFRLNRPSILIDLNRVPELAYIKEADGHIAVGAMTRQRTIENSDLIARHAPLWREGTELIGHLPIRSRGTIGGSLSNADPAAEGPTLATAMGASMVIQGPRGERVVEAADFFRGTLTTALEPDELLTEIRIPKTPDGAGTCFMEISRRRGDFALAGIAAQITLRDGRVAEARLAACGVGDGPVRLTEAEGAITGETVSDESIAAAAEAAAISVEPQSDLHASSGYRRKLVGVLTERALRKAVERAEGGAS